MEAEYDYIVVDDREYQREAIKAILSEGGFECIGEAADGESGAELYFEVFSDFVIMDIDMPGVDGIEGARMILEDDPDAFIIMVSGFGKATRPTISQAPEISENALSPAPFSTPRQA